MAAMGRGIFLFVLLWATEASSLEPTTPPGTSQQPTGTTAMTSEKVTPNLGVTPEPATIAMPVVFTTNEAVVLADATALETDLTGEPVSQSRTTDATTVQMDVSTSGTPSATHTGAQVITTATTSATTRTTSTHSQILTDIPCPANSHYELCGDRCQDSCSASTEPTCLAPCSEGCFCNTGFLRSGNECVSAGQCGCSYEGIYYKLGDMAWMSNCTKRCNCVAPSVFNCVATSCTSPQYCAVKGGRLSCQDDTTSCVVSGGTHYLTFDRSVAHFQGTCAYEITSTCNSSTQHLFHVTAENQKDANMSSISQVTISFQTSGQQVRLVVGRDKVVQVNGTEVSLPASIYSTAQVTYDDEWQDVRVTLWNDTEIRYDGSNTLIIRVGSQYENQLCGLCGNFNGNATDDKVLPDGTSAASDQEFGNAWTSESSSTECSNQTEAPDLSSSNSSQEARDLCRVLTNISGSFADCHQYESPDPFYVSCLYDVSLYGWSNYVRCRVIRSYEQICIVHGAAIATWWPSLNCFPGLVRNLTLLPVSSTTLFISWHPPEGDAGFYVVRILGTPSLNTTVITEHLSVPDLVPGNYYTVEVSAQDGPRQGATVSISGFTVPNVTNDLNVTDVSINSVSLSWLPPTGNKSFYLIQVLGNPASNVTTFYEFVSITNLIPGNYYTFLASAVSGNGLPGKSCMISEYTAFSSEAAEEIYGLIQETRTFSPNISTTAQLIRQFEFLSKKEINQRLHATTLIHYHKNRRIPRGLRIALKPMLCKNSKNFVEKWYQILNKCSLDLILLIVQELSKVLSEIEVDLNNMKKELEKFPDLQTTLEDVNKRLDKYAKEVNDRKVRKYKRDTIDYKYDEVYTWAEIYNQKKWQQPKTKPSTDSSQESLASESDIAQTRQPIEKTQQTRQPIEKTQQPSTTTNKQPFLDISPAANAPPIIVSEGGEETPEEIARRTRSQKSIKPT